MISKTLAENLSIEELCDHILKSGTSADYKMLAEVLATKVQKLTKDVHCNLRLSAVYLERAIHIIE